MNYDIKILMVEDVLTTRLFTRRLLKNLGFNNVVLAEDGQVALQELKSNDFDLIISDWHMPTMDGLDLYRALKNGNILKKIPFLLLTVETDKEKVTEAVKSGIDQYLMKPIQPEELENRIKQIFAEQEV